jgi:phage-related protein
METAIITKGKAFDVFAVTRAGKCQVQGFIDELDKQDQKKVVALVKRLADHGMLANEQKFHKLKGLDLWELKSFQVRIFCFFDAGRIVILTHGFSKKSNETPKEEIAKAIKLQKEYFAGKRK